MEVAVPGYLVSRYWIWFLPPINQKMSLFLPLLHGLQYLPFILMKTKKLSTRNKLLLGPVCLSVGWIFFRWLPFNVALMEGTLWPALILSLLNNHHFVIDGRIWKLRDPVNQDLITFSQGPQFQEVRVPSLK